VDLFLVLQWYFCLGVLVKQEKWLVKIKSFTKKNWRRFLVLGLTAIAIVLIQHFGFRLDFYNHRTNNFLLDLIVNLNGIVFLYALSLICTNFPSRLKKVFLVIGQSTLGVLLFHFFFFKLAYLLLVILGLQPGEIITYHMPGPDLGSKYWWLIAGLSLAASVGVWQLLILLCRRLFSSWYQLKRKLLVIEFKIAVRLIKAYTRSPLSWGKTSRCPVCGAVQQIFLPVLGEKKVRFQAACPVCGSWDRTRFYYLCYLATGLFRSNTQRLRLLHFAPELQLQQIFRQQTNWDYWPVDLRPDFPGIRKVVDITTLPFPNNHFEVIICNHVLEHIKTDVIALKELFRVLRPGGKCYLSFPIRHAKATLENPDYNTDALRAKYYGQTDHVRYYGQNVIQRLQAAGFQVVSLKCDQIASAKLISKLKLPAQEIVFLCQK
jgi:hypothetical protein